MQSPFVTYRKDIQNYCEQNHLNYKKACELHPCWGIDFLDFKASDGANAPVVLSMYFARGSHVFKQTEHTQQYLAN